MTRFTTKLLLAGLVSLTAIATGCQRTYDERGAGGSGLEREEQAARVEYREPEAVGEAGQRNDTHLSQDMVYEEEEGVGGAGFADNEALRSEEELGVGGSGKAAMADAGAATDAGGARMDAGTVRMDAGTKR